MAAEKIAIKEILSWIDNGQSDIWNDLEDEHKKQISFWLLNRYVSGYKVVATSKSLLCLKLTNITIRHFNDIGVGKDNGHPKLMWQLLCA